MMMHQYITKDDKKDSNENSKEHSQAKEFKHTIEMIDKIMNKRPYHERENFDLHKYSPSKNSESVYTPKYGETIIEETLLTE